MARTELRQRLEEFGLEYEEIPEGFLLTGGEDIDLPNVLIQNIVDQDAIITRPEVGHLSGYSPQTTIAIIDDLTTFSTPEDTRHEFGME